MSFDVLALFLTLFTAFAAIAFVRVRPARAIGRLAKQACAPQSTEESALRAWRGVDRPRAEIFKQRSAGVSPALRMRNGRQSLPGMSERANMRASHHVANRVIASL